MDSMETNVFNIRIFIHNISYALIKYLHVAATRDNFMEECGKALK